MTDKTDKWPKAHIVTGPKEVLDKILEKDPKKIRKDRDGWNIPWSEEHDYFMGFDPNNPDIPTD